MAEGARLESVYTATYRGFESPPHRHILRRAHTKVWAFFSHITPGWRIKAPIRVQSQDNGLTEVEQKVHVKCTYSQPEIRSAELLSNMHFFFV